MHLHAYLPAVGRDAEALKQLQKVLELDPNQVVGLVSMAMLYADRGELAEALKIARRAHAIGPWFPDTIGVLATLLRRQGEEVESQSLAKAWVPARRPAMPVPRRFFTCSAQKWTREPIGWKKPSKSATPR
jgi:tetratricopeptide (TPR) repeat protein